MAEFIAADFASRTESVEAAAPRQPYLSKTSGGGQSDFSSVLSAWRDISLPSLTSHLAELSPSLVSTQTEALISRKKLAEQTREFRKLEDEAKIEAFKPLLKAYQAEIDALTNRARKAENAFLSVADRLKGAPDPHPWLELILEQTASLQDLQTLKSQVETLTAENEQLRSKASVVSSLEADRARLSERLAEVEKTSKTRAAEQSAAIQANLSARWEERVSNLTTRESDLSRALEVAQSQLKELRAAHAEATERRVDASDKSSKVEELEIAMAQEDARRANERSVELERRNDRLREELEALRLSRGDEERRADWESRLQSIRDEAARLEAALENETKRAERSVEEERRKSEEKSKALAEKVKEVDGLRRKLDSMADYEEIKRELDIVKYVEFASDEAGDANDEEHADSYEIDPTNAEPAAADSLRAPGAKPLEALLLAKNRKLSDQITTLRVQQTKYEAISVELDSSRSELERLKALNRRLEDDLVNVNMSRTSNTAQKPVTANDEGSTSTVQDKTIPFDASSSAAAQPSASLLPIITSQRDRFRARNAELEEELRRTFESLSEVRNEVKQLQADNLGLYEKVRYLQAYSSTTTGQSSHVTPAVASLQRRDEPADKYKARYEANVANPFQAFRGREGLRVLNPFEKILHQLLSTRRTRLLFMVYCALLHLLIFSILVFE
ncbi:hypothetical protein IE81DRAFT_87548 [Ceraceosorus guamensis]|uniref:Protein CASP n=1 Tax=Ceraceosorus guamensis TaxID=1522189 RepID=A0A316W6S5_9BASI|nr:hypothetical protein IE81DRAFT_87548 [Ceraceosorus guamensis]PWN43345.1 hypothetical protein IE81DRAFT_87548 [Ceraceosorus guamensis]